jgi:hypothetical protein
MCVKSIFTLSVKVCFFRKWGGPIRWLRGRQHFWGQCSICQESAACAGLRNGSAIRQVATESEIFYEYGHGTAGTRHYDFNQI